MKPGVFITFDVECGMGGASGFDSVEPVSPERGVWGKYGDKQLGIPLLVRFLSEHGLKGTFFVEALMEEQGYPDAGAPICQYLLDHGQDVQLHLHPNRKRYALRRQGEESNLTDQIADLPASEQLALLQEGADRIEKWAGRRPTAFRAGNMGASEETLRQMALAGIPIDSSYTFPYAGGQCPFGAGDLYNGSKQYGDTLELALSGFRQFRFPGLRPAKPLDLMGVSFQECRDATRLICRAGVDTVMILHSFSLFTVRNRQYDDGQLNPINTRRFRRYCEWLGGGEFPVYTFSEVADGLAAGTYQARRVPPCKLSHPRALMRKAVQIRNGFYRSKVS